VAVLQGVGIYIVGYFPALTLDNPVHGPRISIGMTSLMMVLIAARYNSVRQGFIRGLLLGILAGMAIYGGMSAQLMATIDLREQAATGLQQPDADDGETTDTSAGQQVTDETPPASAANDRHHAAQEPTDQVPAVAPMTAEDRAEYARFQRQLPYHTVPPPIVICTAIGVIFGHRGKNRLRKVRSMWD